MTGETEVFGSLGSYFQLVNPCYPIRLYQWDQKGTFCCACMRIWIYAEPLLKKIKQNKTKTSDRKITCDESKNGQAHVPSEKVTTHLVYQFPHSLLFFCVFKSRWLLSEKWNKYYFIQCLPISFTTCRYLQSLESILGQRHKKRFGAK